MSNLVNQYCPYVHEAPISAAVYEPYNQTKAIADAQGNIAVYRGSSSKPFAVFKMDGAIRGSMFMLPRGELLAVGDDNGGIRVYNLNTTSPMFEEIRDGARGKTRAFRAVTLSPTGSLLAAISIDNILRIWNLQTGERQNFKGFAGSSLEFDARGERLLLIGEDAIPKLFHLHRTEINVCEKPFTPIEHVRFSRDYQFIFAAGPGGFVLYQTMTLKQINGKAVQKFSGMLSVVSHPVENKMAIFSKRSTYLLGLPDLEIYEQFSHGAPEPSNSGIWEMNNVSIGGQDGIMHSKGEESGVPPTHSVYALQQFQVLCHHHMISIFNNNQRIFLFSVQKEIKEAKISRDGLFLVVSFAKSPMEAYQLKPGQAPKKILEGPPDTIDPASIWVSPIAVAVEPKQGGSYWWHFQSNQGMQIQWAKNITMTEGGKWLGMTTPEGNIQIIDTMTGKKALPDPKPTSAANIVRIAFMGKSSILLALDNEGYLISYDLSSDMIKGAEGKDIMQINSTVQNLWAIQGGQIACVQLQEPGFCRLLYLDITEQQPPQLADNLPHSVYVNSANGAIVQPATCSALLEQHMIRPQQTPQQLVAQPVFPRVYRSLPNNQWLIYTDTNIIALSEQAYGQL